MLLMPDITDGHVTMAHVTSDCILVIAGLFSA